MAAPNDQKEEPNGQAPDPAGGYDYDNEPATGPNSLRDPEDRRRIWENLRDDKISICPESRMDEPTKKKSLYHDVDNVRFAYREYRQEPPEWYTRKYGHRYGERYQRPPSTEAKPPTPEGQ